MPLHTGFSRSKKPKKDNRKRSSTSSTISHSVSRGSIGSVDGNKKETTSPARTNAANHDSMQKPPARLQGKSLETKKKTPDVFDFLDDGRSEGESLSDNGDHAQAAAKLNSTANASPGRHVNNARHQPDSWWYPWTSNPSNRSSVVSRGSTDSHVSPISLDTSPGTAHLQLATKKVTRRRPSTERPQASAGSRTEDPMSKSGWDLSLREAYYPSTKTAASIQRSPLPPSPPKSPEENPHRGGRRSRKNSKALQASSGYGLVASHLTSSADANHIPLYRRFENLNHRVLLHLQDEISQMEEDLHMLDEYEEAHRAAAAEHQGTKIMPASRRMDAHAQAYSSLHYRRQELLGALVQKTEQYNNALTAYNKVVHTLPRAPEKDIENYRAWMKERNPVTATETRFLDHKTDLVSLLPLPGLQSTTPVYSAIVIAATAILMPLLAFSMIAEFSGRLVVVTVVGGAAAAIAANYSTGAERLIDSRDGWRCATIYFGFMTIVAMFIP